MGIVTALVVGTLIGLLAYHVHLKANPRNDGGRFACCPGCAILLNTWCSECRGRQAAKNG